MKSKYLTSLIFAATILLFLLLSFDGATHWDETNYLYKGAFSPSNLDAHWIHYSGGFYSGRLFHIYLLKSLFRVFGVGLIPLVLVELVMAIFIILSGIIFYFVLNMIFSERKISLITFIVFLFSPLSLYLSYKALAETIALLMTITSTFFFFKSLEKSNRLRSAFVIFSSLFLFFASNSRVESLLTFGSLIFPFFLFIPSKRKDVFKSLIFLILLWGIFTVLVGIITGMWSVEFLLNRSATYQKGLAQDQIDYLPNYIMAIMFGGGFWFFTLLSLFQKRGRVFKVAWGALILSIVPVMVLIEHNELRFYHPAIFAFALTTALGIKLFYDWLVIKVNPRPAIAITIGMVCLVVALNQLIRPLQEVGTQGIPLIRLINRLKEKYTDPVLITAHPHSTYAFLRLCYPELRIALDRNFEGMVPLRVRDPEELAASKKPWLYISSQGVKEKPLLMKILHRFKGVVPVEKISFPVIATPWITGSELIQLNLIDREGRYLVFQLDNNNTIGM